MSTLPDQLLTLESITHNYGAGLAVDDVSLRVKGGELLALLGPSGCGKTTLLRIVAGFIQQTRGRVLIGGTAVDPLPPNRREVGIVFQNYALFPHLTVAQNIAYGLAARGESREVQAERVREMLEIVQMGRFAERKPKQLSGGQQQRVALARALAMRPRLLLLDEPFAALDKNLRLDMQIEIKRLQRQFNLTAIMVTHDQDEAMAIADRIAVMSQGRIEQLGSPVEIYDRPATLFVNNFIGSSNLLEGVVESLDAEGAWVRLEQNVLWRVPEAAGFAPGQPVLLSVRPEQMSLASESGPGLLPVTLALSLPIGGELIHDALTPAGTSLKVALPRRPGSAGSMPGSAAHCGLAADARPSLFPLPTA